MSKRAFLTVAIVLAALFPAARRACAEEPASDDKYRYHSFLQDGKLHVFDRKSGRLVRYDGEKDGVATFKTWMLSPEGRGRPETHDVRTGGTLPEAPTADAGKTPPKVPGDHAPRVDPSKAGTAPRPAETPVKAGDITDEMRRAALVDIAEYSSRLSINSMVRTDGDDLAITVLLRNKGDRTIQTMEIAVTVPTVEKKEPMCQRVVLAEEDGYKKPPPPGEIVSVQVRVKAPAGGIPGRCEHEVTFLRLKP